MDRLPNSTLLAALNFVREINAAVSDGGLRPSVVAGLSRLVACDRVNFNEIDFSADRRTIVPTPLPPWWSRYGDLYREYMTEHPLWRRLSMHRPVAFSDGDYVASWKSSTLYNEYFLPLGVKQQLSVLAHKSGTECVGIGFNRTHGTFTPRERALVELVVPHITCAYGTALALAAKAGAPAGVGSEAEAVRPRHVVTVSPDGKTLQTLSAGVRELLGAYFYVSFRDGDRLPDEVCRWLRSQRDNLLRADSLSAPSASLKVKGALGVLNVSVVQILPDRSVLFLDDQRFPAVAQTSRPTPVLTPREREILHWIGEGKRNAEIATILGRSTRTIEKHVENLFVKLGVETRTAAMRQGQLLRNSLVV